MAVLRIAECESAVQRAVEAGVCNMGLVREGANDFVKGCVIKVNERLCPVTGSRNALSTTNGGMKVTNALHGFLVKD